MAPAFMAAIKLAYSGCSNAKGGSAYRHRAQQETAQRRRSTIALKSAPPGSNELAPCVYRKFTWLHGNDWLLLDA
jgi:hypothetical protein